MSLTLLPIASIGFPAWQRLWFAYLGALADGLAPGQHEATYRRLADPNGVLFGIAAQVSDVAVGFAHCYFHPSTYHTAEDCCLQDLYVDASARGQGVGRALVDAVAEEARRRGAPVLHWKTRATNAAALALYERFAQRTEFVSFRLALP